MNAIHNSPKIAKVILNRSHTNFRYLAFLKVILLGNSQGKPACAQLRRCQGSRIGDYSFVLSDVAGTLRMDSLLIANRTFSIQS